MSNYTPTTDEVKACAESDNPYGELPEGQFDRWHAQEIRKAKAQALEEAADVWESGTVDFFEIKYLSDAPLGWSDESVGDAIMSSGPTMDWLRNRAQQLKEES